MSRTLLIDADLIAYRASAALQQTFDWNGDGSCVSVNGRLPEAKAEAQRIVEWFMDDLKADDIVICLSDDVQNFRKKIDPTYKLSRGNTERPVHLYDLKEWMGSKWPSRLVPTLEADDVMGIMSTEPHVGERVIVSSDKDMKTIPGLLCCPDYANHRLKVQAISEEEADRFHLWQTIVGDICDGYPGCPKAGPVMATAVLDGMMVRQTEKTFKAGPRKGETIPQWIAHHEPDVPVWTRVVALYAKFGLTEADALRQARLAFILRHSHYVDGRRREWSPKKGQLATTLGTPNL